MAADLDCLPAFSLSSVAALELMMWVTLFEKKFSTVWSHQRRGSTSKQE